MKKSIYTAYRKVINRKTHYFVKKYDVFTEDQRIPAILDSMGMHTDFLRACELANVESEETVHELMKELDLRMVSGRAVPVHNNLQRNKREEKVISAWYPQYWLSKLKWAHI